MKIKAIGSVCSGIEAASVAWGDYAKFEWFSEIAEFPSKLLSIKYPNIPNVGDMNFISDKLKSKEINSPDMICGGTPCQAFSLAGLKNGLNDERGNLTLKFVDIVETNDKLRLNEGKNRTVVFWENVEGVLKDKTNAFGCFVSYLAGLDRIIELKKWPNAGIIRGPKRNIAWRVLDAKYFGVAQQRKRLYVLAGDKNFYPEEILFEKQDSQTKQNILNTKLKFNKDNTNFEVFREYTDCLYAAYGTKWNGNAAAYNGSLFVVENDRIRRFSPIECERLMGFPDNYTLIPGTKRTNRYQAIGNSWVVPVIKWIGERLFNNEISENNFNIEEIKGYAFIDMTLNLNCIRNGIHYNSTLIPNEAIPYNIKDVVEKNDDESIYISPVGCHGILRRSKEKNISLNSNLEKILLKISSTMPIKEINRKSLRQKRGKK